MTTKAKTAPEITERAQRGSSIAAQCKTLVSAIASELAASGGIMTDTLEWLQDVAGQIASSGQRNLPLYVQLENAENERNAIFLRAGVVDGKFSFATPEDEATNAKLTVKIENLKRKMAKAESDESESGDENTDEVEQGEDQD